MSWRVTYVDLESYAGGRPPQFSLIMIKQPDGYDDQAHPGDLPAEALDALRTWLVGAPTSLHVRAPEPVQEPAKCACPPDGGFPDGKFVLDTCPIHGDSAYRPWPLANPDRVQAIIDRLDERDALPDEPNTEEDTQS